MKKRLIGLVVVGLVFGMLMGFTSISFSQEKTPLGQFWRIEKGEDIKYISGMLEKRQVRYSLIRIIQGMSL